MTRIKNGIRSVESVSISGEVCPSPSVSAPFHSAGPWGASLQAAPMQNSVRSPRCVKPASPSVAAASWAWKKPMIENHVAQRGKLQNKSNCGAQPPSAAFVTPRKSSRTETILAFIVVHAPSPVRYGRRHTAEGGGATRFRPAPLSLTSAMKGGYSQLPKC